MSASRVLLGVDQRLEAEILTRMLEDGHRVVGRCIDADALVTAVAQASRGTIDLVVVSGGERHLTAALVDAVRRSGARLLIVTSGDADAARAAALGVAAVEVVSLSAGWEVLGAAMRRGGDATRTPARRPGTVLAVWHASGSPGATTVAVNLAAEFASSGRRVVLADADTSAASVAPMLGLLDEAPGFAAACRLAASGALDDDQLERIAGTHPAATGAFRVLTGIARSSRWPELTGERVEATLVACRAWADVVIVDTGCCIEADEEISSDFFAPRRNAAALAVLGAADRIIEVGTGDPVGISRLLRGHAELVELVDPGRVSIVVNRVRASSVGLDPAGQIATTLARFGGVSAAGMLPEEQRRIDAAVIASRTVRERSGRSAFTAAIRQLAAKTIPERPASSITRADRRAGAGAEATAATRADTRAARRTSTGKARGRP